MNFLAHAYLSFGDPGVVTGNMISDFVKGGARFGFSGKVAAGIILHRRIDAFTDAHPATAQAKEFFRPYYRLYSGAIVDILYDHFLANDPEQFPGTSLLDFTLEVYEQINAHYQLLPPSFQLAFDYMQRDNWLYNYRERWGVQRSLAGMVRRAAYLSESDTAFQLFGEHYQALRHCYESFFEDVKQYAKREFDILVG